MATEWFYKVGEHEQGPVTSQQLKQLANNSNILPHTPIRRITEGNKSPWTRAGEIKGLFPVDVSNELGEKICGECGSKQKNGICQKCSNLAAEKSGRVRATPPAFPSYRDEDDDDDIPLEPVLPRNDPGSNRVTFPTVMEVSWKKPDTTDWIDSLLRAVGVLHLMCFLLLSAMFGFAISQGILVRFKDDNAIGATANALEMLNYLLGIWLNMFGAFAFYGYASLRRIRNAIAPAGGK